MDGSLFAIVGLVSLFVFIIFKIFMPKKNINNVGGFSPGYNPPREDDTKQKPDIIEPVDQFTPVEEDVFKKKQ